MTALSVRGLFKRYGRVPVLNGIDLDIARGSLTAILGPSGCGKTTLLRIVAGFDRADAGTVALNGTDVSSGRKVLPPDRRAIGYVAQEGALFPHLDVQANITFGLPYLTTGRRQRRDRAAALLELVSLDPSLARRYPHQLSGGQQQRVALARALARKPSLVLLDEPFSSSTPASARPPGPPSPPRSRPRTSPRSWSPTTGPKHCPWPTTSPS
ncbi:ABC transporter ATP-binding protein [Dactylosporangium cerinum]